MFSSTSSTFYSNKNNNEEENKKIQISLTSENKTNYISRNKEALYDYGKLLKKMKDENFIKGKYINYQETKDIFNITYNTPNFKKNPKKIIKSYNIELIGKNFNKKKIYKSRVLGVDEGLIELPKVFSEPNINYTEKNDEKKKKIKIKRSSLSENFQKKELLSKNEEKKKKENNDEELNKIEKYENSIQMINEIKKLDSWDMKHAYRGIRRYITYGTMNRVLSSLGQGNMRWLLDIKHDPQKLKIISRNSYLKNFFNKIDQNQKAIYQQNLKTHKGNFNFDIFDNDNINNNIKKNSKGKNKKRESQIEFYKDAVKEKIKMEDILKNELSNIAQEIYEMKLEKKKLIIQLYDESLKISKIYQEKIKSKEEFNDKMDELKKYFSNENNYSNHKKDIIQKSEMLKKKNEALLKQKELKKNIEEKFEELENEKNEIESNIEDINKGILGIKEEIKRGKMKLNQRIQIMRQYYFDILKNGIDVRRNGLNWVIIELINLKAIIEKSNFPVFLTDSQIDYLLTISYKQYDLSELIKLFQILKEKQKSFREDFIKQENKNKEKQKKQFIQKRNSVRKSGGDFTQFIEEIAKQYENVINICLNETKEEKYINEISDKLKKDILNIYKDEEEENLNNKKEVNELYFLPGSLAEFFNKNQKFRIYFDDIVYLNSEIIKREKELKELRENQIKNFKANLREEKSKKESMENQLIFSALFGNGISL